MRNNSLLSASIKLALCSSIFSISSQVIAADQNNAETIEKVQVIGSRIRTDSFASETPIDIITVEDAKNEGIKTLADLLRTSTAAAGSNQITSAMSVGYVTAGGKGTETASLRG